MKKAKAVAFAPTSEGLLGSDGGVLLPPPPLFFPPGSAETHTQAEFRRAGALRRHCCPARGPLSARRLRRPRQFSRHRRRGYGGTPGSDKMAEEEWPDRQYAALPDPDARRSRGGGSLLPTVAAAACVAAAGIGAFLLRDRVADGASAVAGAVGAQASALAGRVAAHSRASAQSAELSRRRKEAADAARQEREAARADRRRRAEMVRAGSSSPETPLMNDVPSKACD